MRGNLSLLVSSNFEKQHIVFIIVSAILLLAVLGVFIIVIPNIINTSKQNKIKKSRRKSKVKKEPKRFETNPKVFKFKEVKDDIKEIEVSEETLNKDIFSTFDEIEQKDKEKDLQILHEKKRNKMKRKRSFNEFKSL